MDAPIDPPTRLPAQTAAQCGRSSRPWRAKTTRPADAVIPMVKEVVAAATRTGTCITSLVATLALSGRQVHDARLARDLGVRAVGLLWLGWFLAVLLHGGAVGALGVFGAGEWVHVGLTLLATALVLVGWRTTERPGRAVWTLFAALLVPAWVVLLAVSWGFHALLGLSFSIG